MNKLLEASKNQTNVSPITARRAPISAMPNTQTIELLPNSHPKPHDWQAQVITHKYYLAAAITSQDRLKVIPEHLRMIA